MGVIVVVVTCLLRIHVYDLDFVFTEKKLLENMNLVKFRMHTLSAQNRSGCSGMGSGTNTNRLTALFQDYLGKPVPES